MEKIKVTIECLPEMEFEAYSSGEKWNGWECPLFTRQTAFHVLQAMKFNPYGPHLESIIFTDPESEELVEECNGVWIEDMLLFPLGAWSWCWERA